MARVSGCVVFHDRHHRTKKDGRGNSTKRRVYRSLVENSFDGVFVQQGSKIIFANSRLYEMLGYSHGELEGMDHWLVYHPEYHQITRDRAAARMRGQDVTPQYEVKLQKKDGSSFYGEISATPVKVFGETGVQVWVRDISRRIRSEEAQRRLATAIEQAAEVIVIMNTSGRITYVNPAFEKITEYSREEVIGETPKYYRAESTTEFFITFCGKRSRPDIPGQANS